MQTTEFSEKAIALIRQCLDTGRAIVTPENRETFHELARAGVMYPVSWSVTETEANYRFTNEEWARSLEISRRANEPA
jgi:hypothetical protein